MSSIVLQPGVKDMLLADCKDFLASEEWYVDLRTSIVGDTNFLPGMLNEVHVISLVRMELPNTAFKVFHSEEVICCTVFPAGMNWIQNGSFRTYISLICSGKTSLIHSLAGELGLDIYVVSLSSKGCVFHFRPPLHAL